MATPAMTENEIDEKRVYQLLDPLYLLFDKRQIRRTRNIRLIPHEDNRRGGKYAYAEWAHVIGIFQTLLYLHLEEKWNNRILDVGCGTGLLAIASEPYIAGAGKYVGIDVLKQDIEFCRRHYPQKHFEFIHLDKSNSAYAPMQTREPAAWPIQSGLFNMVTALSVWTHLNEEEAFFYFREISRVLKPGGKAIVTFFLLDALYHQSLTNRTHEPGKFHMTFQDSWIFDQPAYGSEMVFHPRWAKVPEQAIGVTRKGVERLVEHATMEVLEYHPGNWKEIPGLFFQDVLVFQKTNERKGT